MAGLPGTRILAWALLLSALPPCADPPADSLFGAKRHLIAVGKHAGFLLEPPVAATGGSKPWAWYAPTFIGSYPNAACGWYMERLLRNGFWIAGLDIGESYGNPAGRKAFDAFYDSLRLRGLDARACLLPQSRGGLMLYNWAAEPGNAAKVNRIAGIYTVGDLRSYPGLATAAPAYGMTAAELERNLAAHNPLERLAPLRAQNIPILHIHGDADALVPLDRNSAALRERYLALGGSMEVAVVPGKGHAEIPEFFQDPRMLQFMLAAAPTFLDGPALPYRPPSGIRPARDARDALGRVLPSVRFSHLIQGLPR